MLPDVDRGCHADAVPTSDESPMWGSRDTPCPTSWSCS